MGIVAYTAQFGLFEWAMFGLFSLGAVGLAAFDGRTYAYVPWQAMAVNVVMVMGWEGADPATLALVVAGFGLLFALSGQAFLPRSVNPLSRAGLSAAAAVLYFLVAFDRLNWAAAHTDLLRGLVSPDAFWAGLAFLIAAGMSAAASRPFVLGSETGRRHRLQAIFAVAATSLVSIGLAIALHQQYLSFAIAVQIFALAWIATRVDVPALRILAQVLTAEFALLLIPNSRGCSATVSSASRARTRRAISSPSRCSASASPPRCWRWRAVCSAASATMPMSRHWRWARWRSSPS